MTCSIFVVGTLFQLYPADQEERYTRRRCCCCRCKGSAPSSRLRALPATRLCTVPLPEFQFRFRTASKSFPLSKRVELLQRIKIKDKGTSRLLWTTKFLGLKNNLIIAFAFEIQYCTLAMLSIGFWVQGWSTQASQDVTWGSGI